MGKYQQECDYQAIIANHAEEIERLNDFIVACVAHGGKYLSEIERLNAQVAMHREALLSAEEYLISRGIQHRGVTGRTVVLPKIQDAINSSFSDWLANHDAKVRDDAIEEMAIEIESFRSSYDKYSVAEAVRSMKGTK